MISKQRTGYMLLAAIGILAFTAILFLKPIVQDENYHHFSDAETIFGIPNFWNVVSNLPFLLVGMLGIYRSSEANRFKLQYSIFFAGLIFVAFGSAFYHLQPGSETLILDRLPMTIAFMALLSILVSEFIDAAKGTKLLFPLLFMGGASIAWWVCCNDLRFYALVQFYPMMAIPVMLICFGDGNALTQKVWLLLAAYIIAKLCEHFDVVIHEQLCIISGHSLKHLIAGIGVYFLVPPKQYFSA